jgi:tetratricopeptide (TPR) repeat protein
MVVAGNPFRAFRGALRHLLGAPEPAGAAGPAEAAAPSAVPPRDPLEDAVACCLEDRWVEARDALRRLATVACRCPRTWRALGVAHGRLGDWRRAQAALEEARRLAPGDPAGELLTEVRAVRRWARAIEHRPWDAEAHCHLGVLLLAWEHPDDALDHLRRAAKLRPDWAPPHLYAGMELHCRGERAGAEQEYEEALRLAPDDRAARMYLDALRAGRLPVDEDAPAEPDAWLAALAG